MSKYIDLTNKQFGQLTVLYRVENNKYGKAMWHCKCSCGKEKNIIGSNLINGSAKSCGCGKNTNSNKGRPPKIHINIGDKFGDLICIGIEKNEKNYTYYNMKCEICGRTKLMLGSTIMYKHGIAHKSCGKGLKTKNKKFYERWCSMRERTENPNYEHSNCYRERGINSEEFKYFIDFYDTMYESFIQKAEEIGEENVSLDRINPNKSYTKDNCRWIHKNEQQANCRNTICFQAILPNGTIEESNSIRKFAEKYNLDEESIRCCIMGRYTQHKGFKFIRIENPNLHM